MVEDNKYYIVIFLLKYSLWNFETSLQAPTKTSHKREYIDDVMSHLGVEKGSVIAEFIKVQDMITDFKTI